MVSNSTSFSDIQNHWARLFITALAERRILNGYPDRTFRPNNSVTRAEFAAIIAKVFTQPSKRAYVPFTDVPANHWAANAIKGAYETGFLSGYPDRTFRPNDRIARGDVLVALVNGLDLAANIKPDLLAELPQIYKDAANIAGYAKNQAAIATKAGIVVSYPDIKLLNPNIAATRADVAAIVYQALVYLGKAEKIASNYIVAQPTTSTPTPTLPNTVKVNHRREFRGAWVACVWNSDWPKKAGLSALQQQAELVNIIEKLQTLNFNALILQVRPEGDALYASQLEPWSAWLTGTQGQAPIPFYDPLEFAIAECRKRNIELHAWFNPYRAKTSIKQGSNVRPHIAVTNPEYVYQWGNQLWMEPGAKIVQDRVYNVILDVVRRYDVDGIHLDDYFYPYPIQGQSFPDHKTYAAYQAAGGKLSLGDWRRENVNQMVLRLAEGIKSTKPDVKFGISPFGIYRPGQPPGITGLDAYNVLYADAKKWLEQGWIDYIAPQLYWRTDQTQQSYPTLLKWWTEINPKQRHIYAGNNISQLDGKAWKDEEIEKQIKISRNLVGDLSLGNIFFSTNSLIENRQGISETFQNSLYAKPALVPTMSWQNATPPTPPTALQVNNRKISWQPGDEQKIRSWTLYRQSSDSWTLQRVLSAGTTFATVEPGTYAVCAVDGLANESVGVVISVI
ncbi:MAG: family 10 glycosylhydrolase [Chlorogloeopsis fritschii C42_A2020_084]|uniref:glycoside hydrolase family 10 protein n=1 Tax=Chlorogloeopsis fritschii TaxID=1124 RepID=UPI0019F4672E|nr:family 10 glycosylhydrolase [Chlorogloeopsis fritschii]MBF2007544.1 family 10 glycosylhydrolase [Chlorogloeopsis fritschii C42_A2020_084]